MTGPRIKAERILASELWGDVMEERLTPVHSLTESAMRGRVIMLKRMKRTLICDWHPIIDVLLGDYEGELRRAESLRETPDTEPDVQDRDFDDEATGEK